MPRRHTTLKSLKANERAFGVIEATLAELAAQVRSMKRGAVSPKRQLQLSPKRRAQLKLQGAYMGYMRQLKPAQKLRVKAVKAKRGFEAAIGVARGLTAK